MFQFSTVQNQLSTWKLNIEKPGNLYFSLDEFDQDIKLALALSAEEARKPKELDIGNNTLIILTYLCNIAVYILYSVGAALHFYSMSELI